MKPTPFADKRASIALQLGDIVPDFTQASTEGPIHFHDWAQGSWVVLFSHPKDYTPVCTTELGTVAKLKPEFDRRNVKVIGLSVDGLENHGGWSAGGQAAGLIHEPWTTHAKRASSSLRRSNPGSR